MFVNRVTNYIAAAMLGIMFLMLFFSSRDDSAIMDELAHIPAGYSYLTHKDMRLNPEHPPLIKDIAAFPLLFLNLKFPTNQDYWTKDINGQWTAGTVFLYEAGNNPEKILRFARFPIILLAILFGFLLFRWVRGLYGKKVALLTLFFFAFSPIFLAHSRYVTTDLGAAFGFFIGIAAFLNFLKKEFFAGYSRALIIAGISFGIAELLKFSLFLLVPLYVIFGALFAFSGQFTGENKFLPFKRKFTNFLRDYLRIFLKTLLIFLIGGVIIWAVYAFHIYNYPHERQISDTVFTLGSFKSRFLADLVIKMAGISFLRPIAEYLLGLFMVIQRASGGNTTYFLGEVSVHGSWYYFPTAYALKENLAFHILTILSLFVAARRIIRAKNKSISGFFEWIRINFAVSAAIIFIVLYLGQSISSPLNIGLRHILPTFPFIYMLVSRELVLWANNFEFKNISDNFLAKIVFFYYKYILPAPKYFFITAAMLWIFLSAVFTFPYYLSYYNELAGGTKNGYKFITDSNYDWGQDLKRLNFFAEKNNIQKIYVDYFGGGSPKYYLGDKFIGWNAARGIPPAGSYLAVSATFLQGSNGIPEKGIIIDREKTYYFLKDKEMFGRGGMSIFVYKIQ